MLVLSRRVNEFIDVGNDISICIVDIRGDKVRVGINAPKDVPVHRREITEAIKRAMSEGTKDEQEGGDAVNEVEE